MTTSTDGPRGFFGELYLRSTRPFLPEAVSDAEAAYLTRQLGDAMGAVLDLGCGHGRHLARLGAFKGRLVGVDFDALSLREASAQAPVVRGSFFQLPFRAGAFGSAFCWYNTLGTFEDEAVPLALAEVARCVRRGGRLIVHGSSPGSAERQPEASFDGLLPDGARLIERVRYDRHRRRDQLTRELTTLDGRLLSASFFIRYFSSAEWEALLAAAGFEIEWVHGAVDGSAPDASSVDQIIGARRT
ncbi:MAG: class I SAM-dependent methyltransferase [Myxococcaceae bacterium]|nr:class I SAM-dependent methyltransferase [Myxococcaceae bacterium]